ncbi:MAG TPA: aminotransferase class IV [Casimicrobiaceae bacterium]|nr:aminotransferase class IV [Casimicrobiaceae bacterium]
MIDRCELNGAAASAADLRALATTNYGHFTAMQLEHGGVRGLDLHLARLDASTRELFGQPLAGALVRGYARRALDGFDGAASMRINVFARALQRERMAEPAAPDVVVSIGAPRRIETTPLRLKSFRYERVLPHVKHVGTFGMFHHRRLAQLDGFDDALFVDAGGAVSEASVWNIGFFDGKGIVWPDAPALRGISMQLLQKGLGERGVPSDSHRIAHADIGAFRSAFLTNCSCAVRPIGEIDGVGFTVDPELDAMLAACYASNAPQAI